jgi:hypothetical protein
MTEDMIGWFLPESSMRNGDDAALESALALAPCCVSHSSRLHALLNQGF